jgi:hypothetical protein
LKKQSVRLTRNAKTLCGDAGEGGGARGSGGRSASGMYAVKSVDVQLVYEDAEARAMAEIQDLCLVEDIADDSSRGVNPVRRWVFVPLHFVRILLTI